MVKMAENNRMAADANAPPRLHFGQDLQRRVRGPSESVRDHISAFYDMTPLESEHNMGWCQVHNWFATTCIFSQADIDMVTVRRSRAQAEYGGHLVHVHRYLHGSVRGQFKDTCIDRDPGSIYIFDMERRVECVQFPMTVRGLYIPKWLIGYDSAFHAPLIGLPNRSVLGDILTTLIDTMFDDLFEDNCINPEHLEQFFASLKVALGTSERSGDARKWARVALERSMRSFIEQNIASPDLSVQIILDQFGISRASLYRMFEHYGGVRQYLSDRRLYRAILELSEKPLRRGDIVDVAERWNFSSQANFNRSVKRHFGAPPRWLVNLSGNDRKTLDRHFAVHAFSEQTRAGNVSGH